MYPPKKYFRFCDFFVNLSDHVWIAYHEATTQFRHKTWPLFVFGLQIAFARVWYGLGWKLEGWRDKAEDWWEHRHENWAWFWTELIIIVAVVGFCIGIMMAYLSVRFK